MEECCQLVKENSIEGCKQGSVKVVFTPWENLRKDKTSMDVGTIGFHDMRKCTYRTVSKDKAVLRRILRTKSGDETPDYRKLRIDRDDRERKISKQERKSALEAARAEQEERERLAKLHSFDGLFDEEEIMAGHEKGVGSSDEAGSAAAGGAAAGGSGSGASGHVAAVGTSSLSKEERRARARDRRERRKAGKKSDGAGKVGKKDKKQDRKRRGKTTSGTKGSTAASKADPASKVETSRASQATSGAPTKKGDDEDSLFGSDSEGGKPAAKKSQAPSVALTADVGAEFGDISSESEGEEGGGGAGSDDGFM